MKLVNIEIPCPYKDEFIELHNNHLKQYNPRYYVYYDDNRKLLLYITAHVKDGQDESSITYLRLLLKDFKVIIFENAPWPSKIIIGSASHTFEKVLAQIPSIRRK